MVNNIEAFGISVETILSAIVSHLNYNSLDHFGGGGSCTGKIRPLAVGELVENVFTNIMHKKQEMGLSRAVGKATNQSKLRLMDIAEAFGHRRDGHPGPYRSSDPNKISTSGTRGWPTSQDCLRWCMPAQSIIRMSFCSRSLGGSCEGK
ncbi:hypothetical protein CDL15_Pgr021836 [Punica granatum]|uniref:Trichome birefringence-like C-terminal domain-containing protein n=1 Tax=Punica granatum TaxID=22663 RepID=A0A218WTY5_PUNGR|nr:hypothetical protein CDL15_Pgr021836 [Punica granatum]PKI32987.1 hypothetical protein CRG98_046625 [Punica granatum]